MSEMQDPLHDQARSSRLAVVTGAASGIGRSTVELFLATGWSVVAVDRNAEALQGLVANETGAFTTVSGTLEKDPLDVSNPEQVSAWAARLRLRHPAVGALINAAGIGLFARRLEDIGALEWERVLATNLTGPFLMTKAIVPLMKGYGGFIVNLSSVHAVATSFGMAAYASAKAGLIGLTRATAVDYRSHGIRANCIVIGSVDTPMSAEHKAAMTLSQGPELKIDAELMATPRQVARVIRFLCSDDAIFVNGAAMTVDGGLLAHL